MARSLHAVVNQQLSVKAGAAIYGRLHERFGGRPPTPEELLADDPEELRAAVGLSRSKVGFMRSLAEHILSGELELDRLDALSDEEVMAELVAVKGIGEWTAHMFLMSHLHRPDVMAPGDLGIKPRDRTRLWPGRSPTARRSSASPSAGARTARSPAAICGAR